MVPGALPTSTCLLPLGRIARSRPTSSSGARAGAARGASRLLWPPFLALLLLLLRAPTRLQLAPVLVQVEDLVLLGSLGRLLPRLRPHRLPQPRGGHGPCAGAEHSCQDLRVAGVRLVLDPALADPQHPG